MVVALAVLGIMWTLAAPIGAAPDDGFHLASIWCSPTAPDDACTNLGDAFAAGKDFVDVPAEIGPGAHCYALDPTASAACQDEIERGTTVRSLADDGIYPGLYYTVMGLVVGDQPVNSALLARVVSWTLCIGFLLAGWLVLPRRHRAGYAIMLLVTAVPLAVSLWASTNPSGLVVAAVAASWCAVVALLHGETRREQMIAGTLLVLGVVAAAGSRADGGLYAFIAVVAACALLWRRDRKTIGLLLGAVGVAALGLAVSLIVASTRVVSVESAVAPGEAVVAREGGLFWNNLREIPYFITGNFGLAPIGWLDTPMPRMVWAPTLAAFVGLAFWGIGRIDREKALSLAGVLGGLLIVPYFLLWRGGYPVGFEIQPRYVLPLVPVLGFTALYWRRATSVSGLTVVQLSTVLVLLTVAHSIALHSYIRRFVTGVDVLSIDLDAGREWWWEMPLTPNMVWVLGSAAFGVLAAVVGVRIRAGIDCEQDPDQSENHTYP